MFDSVTNDEAQSQSDRFCFPSHHTVFWVVRPYHFLTDFLQMLLKLRSFHAKIKNKSFMFKFTVLLQYHYFEITKNMSNAIYLFKNIINYKQDCIFLFLEEFLFLFINCCNDIIRLRSFCPCKSKILIPFSIILLKNSDG